MTWLSGAYLTNNGWQKTNLTWTKNNQTIIFDGAKFLFDGKRIDFIEELQATNIQNDRTNSNSGITKSHRQNT